MAVRYTCDICGKKCNGEKYMLPWPKTYINGKPDQFIASGYNLCIECCNEFFETVYSIINGKDKKHENN